MENIYASIITIGDELLIGQVIDTNSAWMAQELNKIGILVKKRASVGDVWYDIWRELDTAAEHVSVVLITGGLGPTADDITKPLLTQYFGGSMHVDEWTLEHVRKIFTRLNRPLIPANIKQAEVPDSCMVIRNQRGTAPGMWFEKNGVIYVSMPGVPHEMKGMMTAEVLPRLRERFVLPTILHKTLLTAGVGESFLAAQIADWEKALPEYIKLAYLPDYGMVRLRLSATGFDAAALEQRVQQEFDALQKLVAGQLVTNIDQPIEAALLQLLKQYGKTVSTAESCTGGYMAQLITSISGASEQYKGSVISYSNEIKQTLLGVTNDTLKQKGAVSEETVQQMARGVLAQTKTDYAVAVSGIMGPDGGSDAKPVGTVWVAVANANKINSHKFQFRYDRRRNIELTATNALYLLMKFIKEEEG